MRVWIRTTTVVTFAALAAWLTLSIPDTAQAQAQRAHKAKVVARGFAQAPRAQTLTYHFKDTNEDLPISIMSSPPRRPDRNII